jgi:hypothetical protein
MIKVIKLDLGRKLYERGDRGRMESTHEESRFHACDTAPPAVAMIEVLIRHGVT